ncbi:hypothetical protein [Hymenobacter chitinivorans]|uniref:Uncharacterized protein n=1 Tax=Hymenobacter chitinivorans DSM 11115 TaxID=1121954 RepID=A0A2M9BR63_9BACT|nr:hypothetical protein [Hymenobacter chitinivorans]PJJ60439.1 hypothetical protein CLV45_1866 [Hymenobacter chitinivorans DSM 11115]
MPGSPIPDNQMVTVMVAETTFAVLTMPGKKYRVDFVEKAEALLKPGMRGKFFSCSEHPLLLRYNSGSVSVYINSLPQDPQSLFGEIQARIQALLQSWRDWREEYSAKQLLRNLAEGTGLLLDAPVPVAKAVIAACTAHGVATWVADPLELETEATPAFHLLLVGDGYVIAEDFRFVPL